MKSLASGTLVLTLLMVFVMSGLNLKTFLNLHSIVLVFVGTIGVFWLSTPPEVIKVTFQVLTSLLRPSLSEKELHNQLLTLGHNRDAQIQNAPTLMRYIQELWEKGTEPETVQMMLLRRTQELNNSQIQVVTTLRNLAKYPPALGMTGTVIGLVSLFSNLTTDNKAQLGPSLALAMTATFYGLIVSNLVLMPLADRIHIMQLASSERNIFLYKILIMIHQNQSEIIIKDEMNVRAA